MRYWIAILWIPLGNIYLFWYKYMYVGGVTLKEVLTDRQYKLMVLDSGIFGLLTPWLNHNLRHKHRKIDAPAKFKINGSKNTLTHERMPN
jgi:hypothetical protein